MSTEDLSYFQEEEFKKNLALYEQMLQGGQPVYLEADELTDIAEYYLVQNDTDKAMACIQYALDIHPGSIDPLIFLARQKMFNGDIEDAKNIRDRITDSNDREVIFLNAELLMYEGKEQEATAYLSEKAEAEKEDAALFAYDTATLFLDYGYLKQAAQWGQRALDMEPDNEKFLKLKADNLISSNHTKEAIELLNRLLDVNPYDLHAWHSLGEAYFICEDFSKTVETADFALAIDEHDAQALLLKANSLFQQQDLDEAHRLYLRYFKEHPSNEIPYLFDGMCLSALERYDEALSQLLKAEELSKGYPTDLQHIYANLSDVYSRLHDTDKALGYIDKIKEIDPDYEADLYKGHILMQNERENEALEYYSTFIQNHEDPSEAHFLVGLSLVENKLYERAREHFLYTLSHHASQDKGYQKAYAHLAYCALMQNRYQEFIAFLKIACEKAPEALEYTVGLFIPEEVEAKDFYQYVLTHSDMFTHFDPDAPTPVRPM